MFKRHQTTESHFSCQKIISRPAFFLHCECLLNHADDLETLKTFSFWNRWKQLCTREVRQTAGWWWEVEPLSFDLESTLKLKRGAVPAKIGCVWTFVCTEWTGSFRFSPPINGSDFNRSFILAVLDWNCPCFNVVTLGRLWRSGYTRIKVITVAPVKNSAINTIIYPTISVIKTGQRPTCHEKMISYCISFILFIVFCSIYISLFIYPIVL